MNKPIGTYHPDLSNIMTPRELYAKFMDHLAKGRYDTIDYGVRSDDGVVDTVDGQRRRRTGTGNERRNWTDAVKGLQLHEREQEGQRCTERGLVLDDTGEIPQSTTRTTNGVLFQIIVSLVW